jgi:hypothetical protein
MRKLALVMLVTVSMMHSSLQVFAADSELGISLQVLQGGTGSSANLNKNNRLWFVIEPGSSGTRDVIINSASEIPQRIKLSIAARSQLNGELRYDSDAVTVVSEWATFSVNDFLLEPGQSKQVSVSISVPKDAAVEVFQPALLVNSVATVTQEGQYQLPGALQISQGIFLGVGTDEDFKTSFVIDDVFGQISESGKTLQVKISNTGNTPIAIMGDVQLSSAPFFETTIGPLSFRTATIDPGESGFGEIAVGAEVPEDRYRILVRASQGFITETREFEKEIDFRDPSQLSVLLIWLAIILISLVVAIFSIRVLRSTSPAELGSGKSRRVFPYSRTPKSKPHQEPVFEPVPELETMITPPAGARLTKAPESSALVAAANTPLVVEPNLEPITSKPNPAIEPLRTASTQEPLTVKPEASLEPSAKASWKLPKLTLPPIPKIHLPKLTLPPIPKFQLPKLTLPPIPKFQLPKLTLPPIPKFQLPKWRIPTLPKLKFPKVDFCKVSKALFAALPKPKPRPAGIKAIPATEAPLLESQKTSLERRAQGAAPLHSKPATPAPPRQTSPYVRPTGTSTSSASTSDSSPSSGPKPSKRIKLSHTLPVLFLKHVYKLVKKRFFGS